METYYFLDFDDVLFNTRAFVDDLIHACAPHGVSPQMWRETYAQRSSDVPGVHAPFTIVRFAQLLADRPDVSATAEELTASMQSVMTKLPHYVFDDVIPVLERMPTSRTYILTYGDDTFQRTRVRDSGIAACVADVFVTQEQKVHVLTEFLRHHQTVSASQLVYADDRATYFAPVKELLPDVYTVLVTRPERRYDDAPTPYCDAVVSDMLTVEREVVRTRK